MAFVSKEKFLARQRPFVDVPVGEYDGFEPDDKLRIWNLTAKDGIVLQLSFYNDDARLDPARLAHARARLIVATLGDENGLFFTDEQVEQVENYYDQRLFKLLVKTAEDLTGFDATQDEFIELFKQRQQ
jgi:hypothetical protein